MIKYETLGKPSEEHGTEDQDLWLFGTIPITEEYHTFVCSAIGIILKVLLKEDKEFRIL